MESYRDRTGSRFDRGMDRDRSDRDRMDRSDRDRYDRDRSRGRMPSDGMDVEMVVDAVEKSNRDQMDAIADYFDEAREDRLESEKVIVRAVDDNAKLLSDLYKAVKDIQVAPAQPVVQEVAKEEYFDEPSVEPSAKDEILRAVGDNKALLTLIRQDMITVTQRQAEDSEKAVEAVASVSGDALTAEKADQYYKDLEEHVHKENVKCYRNVQAAIAEQSTKDITEFSKSLTGIKVVSILSLAFSIITLLLVAAGTFNLI